MSRLLDRLLVEKVPFGETWEGIIMRDELPRVPLFVVDNVAEYFYAGSEKDEWNPEDFPNIAPPFPAFWMEARVPSVVRDSREAHRVDPGWTSFGGLCLIHDLADPRDGDAETLKATDNEIVKRAVTEGARWLMTWRTFTERNRKIRGAASHFFYVLPDGKMGALRWTIADEGVMPEADPAGLASAAETVFLLPFLLALTFLHCKNVKTSDHMPLAKLSAAHERRHGLPLLRFKTLEIEAMKEMLRTEGRSGRHGLRKALHICRGHFAHYGPDRKLFGRLEGTFWKPQHVRGGLAAGAVIKEYDVKLAEEPGYTRSKST